MLCELRVTLEWPEDVSKWLAGEATIELIEVRAEDGRRGVLGMTDGSATSADSETNVIAVPRRLISPKASASTAA